VSEAGVPSGRPVQSSAAVDLLEHPGDVKLRVRGTSLAELIANAAQGMMSYLFGAGTAKTRTPK
jgi:SHS2 domain-containing protein